MKRYLLSVIMLCSCSGSLCAQDKKEGDKTKELIEQAEQRYQKAVRKKPGIAETYWEHANVLAGFRSEFRRADDFYRKAISLDSLNGQLYKDYGRYLFDKLNSIDEAKQMLTKAAAFRKDDEEIGRYLEIIGKALAQREEERKLKDFGNTSVKELNPGVDYAVIKNFDSLKTLVADTTHAYGYKKLLRRFLADDPALTPAEMYLLMVGYSIQDAYNPFSYMDIYGLQSIKDADIAIHRANELLETNPLNPSIYRELMYQYRKKNDAANAEKCRKRITRFFDAMLYSGDGSCEKPYVSLWAKEHTNFAAYLGYTSTAKNFMSNCAGQVAERFEIIDPATGAIEPIYFNTQMIFLAAMGK